MPLKASVPAVAVCEGPDTPETDVVESAGAIFVPDAAEQGVCPQEASGP